MVEPRHAVAYHTFDDFDIAPESIAAIRKTYDGELTLASDLLVWNVTKDTITVREVIGADNPLPAKSPVPAGPPDASLRTKKSDWLEAERLNLTGK